MLKVVFLAIIIGVTVRTTRANVSKESQCREELEDEIREYVKLDTWQQLFTRHFKFIVTENGQVLSERKRLKFNTIMHNAIYGCDHDRDDEVDDCPNVCRGCVKSCNHGRNLRSAMFRAARCSLVESSVKHVTLSDALLDAYPPDKLDKLYEHVDRPIREFGETVANMLSTLAHGETGGLGELMAVNLYLNNGLGAVLMHKVPVEPVANAADYRVAAGRMRDVHAMLLDKMHAFWDTWCGDRDVVAQYRAKYRREPFVAVLDEMNRNRNEADELLRGLNVSSGGAPLDVDPGRIALAEYARDVVSSRSMPGPVLDGLRLRSFEASYQFDPSRLRAYHKSLFRDVYACFYWATVTHLKLADRIAAAGPGRLDAAEFARYARPLTVFNVNRYAFVGRLPPKASANLIALASFLSDVPNNGGADVSPARVRRFVDLLTADMAAALDMTVPDAYFDGLSTDGALTLMRSNYKAFARLVAATSGHREDRANVVKLKKFFYFLSETVDFEKPDIRQLLIQ